MDNDRIAPADPYERIAELYDLEHGTYDDDLDLYRHLAHGTKLPILELGCGSGRILVPLAAAGSRVTGVDSSPPMLARAEVAVREAGVGYRVELRPGTMEEPGDLAPGSFGLVLLALNSLLHVSSSAAQRRTLTGARRALASGGRLAVDLLNPHPEFLRSMERGVEHEGSWLRGDGSRVDKFASRRVFAAAQQIETDLWYDVTSPAGDLSRTATSYTMRYLHQSELELLLELAGFTTCQFYGSYDLDQYDDESDRLLVIAS